MKLRISTLFFILFLIKLNGVAQNEVAPFYDAILQFKQIDKTNPPPKNAILFVGSSSFTMWHDIQDYFPNFVIINRGFGGSTLADQIRFVDDVVFPYAPKQIVIYCGENDFANSDTITSQMVIQRFSTLFNLIRTDLPEVTISYVSMKPSPSRWHLKDKFIEANQGIQRIVESNPNASYINIWDGMLGFDATPNKDLFLDDMLHMNAKGYALWQKAITPHLSK
jgi:lysophospholipase L1-like esterase